MIRSLKEILCMRRNKRHPGRTAVRTVAILFFRLPAFAEQAPCIESFDTPPAYPMSNFDVLDGVWDIESYSLKERMRKDETWEYNSIETEHRVLLGGYVAINDTYGTFNGRKIHGIMIRTYDPDSDEWTFDWMSRDYPHLTEQVRGRFENGVGVFYGEEVNEGRKFRMRFRWKMLSNDHAYWDQSYQNPATNDWQVNWAMHLTRKPGSR